MWKNIFLNAFYFFYRFCLFCLFFSFLYTFYYFFKYAFNKRIEKKVAPSANRSRLIFRFPQFLFVSMTDRANDRPEIRFRIGGERVHRLGTNGSASRQHEGCMRAGFEWRAVCGTARTDRRSLHPEAHQETEQPAHSADPRQRGGTDAQDLLLRVRLSDEGRRLSPGKRNKKNRRPLKRHQNSYNESKKNFK